MARRFVAGLSVVMLVLYARLLLGDNLTDELAKLAPKLRVDASREETVARLVAIREDPAATPAIKARTWHFEGLALACPGNYEMAVQCFRQALALKEHLTPAEQLEAYGLLGSALDQCGLPKEAIAAYQERYAMDPGFAAGTALAAAQVKAGRPALAVAVYRQLAERANGLTLDEQVKVQEQLTDLYLEQTKDVALAIQASETALKLLGDPTGGATLARRRAAQCKLAQAKAAAGQREEAVAILQGLLPTAGPVGEAAAAAFASVSTTAERERAVNDIWQRLAAAPPDAGLLLAAQATLVELLLRDQRYDEALVEARAGFVLSAAADLKTAIPLVGRALKARACSLVPVNRFFVFVRYGPAGEDGKDGTADDLADPLPPWPAPGETPRAQAYRAAAAKCQGDWQGLLVRSQYELLLGQPVVAFATLRRSFELCPPNQGSLQQVVDALGQLALRSTGNSSLTERYVAFLLAGTEGPDGKPGTADDLTDPTSAIERLLGGGKAQ